MSYDLSFWREQPGATLDPDIVAGLQYTEELPGLIPIPRDAVVTGFRERFPDVSGGDAELDCQARVVTFRLASLSSTSVTFPSAPLTAATSYSRALQP